MSSLTGSKDTWHPPTTANTTTSSYWLNWRVLLCCIWLLLTLIFASTLISKHEGFRRRRDENEEDQQDSAGTLFEDETWKPCLKGIHPAWLLAFRVVAFFVLLVMLFVIVLADGGTIFYYYTQWTFTLITFYFGLGTSLSLHGCYQYHKRTRGDRVGNVELDAEQGNIDSTAVAENSNNAAKSSNSHHHQPRQPAGIWGYIFQIIFQMNAGAVLLTDCVFWFIIVPFLEINDYRLNFLAINMHTINAVFLFGDAALNCLRFPCFRIAYVFLWTVTYTIFQWVLHASVRLWWPYPFLDLSSSFAPLWYFSVAVMHIPCYGAFALVMKLKHHLLLKWFPESYQCVR
ncbi:uncharacterized protein LOC110807835 [Carica papaya]|uniref:uncharacterized protein LOC110807835 n=1 Tax=Carica papaya TaxID=3649 RepID=UPI000B8C99EA|nr:uncharacterized protein LOC110807835 [Carica papaya]